MSHLSKPRRRVILSARSLVPFILVVSNLGLVLLSGCGQKSDYPLTSTPSSGGGTPDTTMHFPNAAGAPSHEVPLPDTDQPNAAGAPSAAAEPETREEPPATPPADRDSMVFPDVDQPSTKPPVSVKGGKRDSIKKRIAVTSQVVHGR